MRMTTKSMDSPHASPVLGPNPAASAVWMCMITHATRSVSGSRMATALAPRYLGGRHRVVTAWVERVAPGNARHRKPESAARAVLGERCRAARGLDPAPRAEQRAHEPPVTGDGDHEQPGRHRWRGAGRIVSSTL